jgi:hypothetical protein
MPVAQRVDILMRGLAHVGIIALVDEATGYQNVRARSALEEILEAFVAKEFRNGRNASLMTSIEKFAD